MTLRSRDVDGIAAHMASGKVRRVVVMSGAGISTSAGIPDFRSPETGLYANLARLKLPYAEAVFDISYFRRNPEPFYTLAAELYPGTYRPTVTHSFIRLLHERGLLLKHFTQNIDCLDREAGVPGDKIVEAHGSFATQRCIDCAARFPDAEMLEHVKAKEVPRCAECGGLVKPDIVFFGESLPAEFFAARGLPAQADLVIVLGTSLTVHPFAGLPQLVPPHVPRVLINLEQVGGIGSRPNDVLLLGDCDAGVRKLAKAFGWDEELEKLWAETGGKGEKGATEQAQEKEEEEEEPEDEIDKLTKDVERTLQINQEHADRLMNDPALKEKVSAHVKDGDAEPQEAAKAKKDPEVPTDPKSTPASTKDGGGDLSHVFPHLKKDSSL